MMKAPLHNSVANQSAGPESADFGNLVCTKRYYSSVVDITCCSLLIDVH